MAQTSEEGIANYYEEQEFTLQTDRLDAEQEGATTLRAVVRIAPKHQKDGAWRGGPEVVPCDSLYVY